MSFVSLKIETVHVHIPSISYIMHMYLEVYHTRLVNKVISIVHKACQEHSNVTGQVILY
jgi:hypothetical protein